MRAELPVIGELGEREQVLASAWLTGLRSARTRRAYAGNAAAWLGWLASRNTDVLAAGRVHVDLWAATWLDSGAAASSVRRRLQDQRPVRHGQLVAADLARLRRLLKIQVSGPWTLAATLELPHSLQPGRADHAAGVLLEDLAGTSASQNAGADATTR